jgi:Putative zinc-binding metallo-peptidase
VRFGVLLIVVRRYEDDAHVRAYLASMLWVVMKPPRGGSCLPAKMSVARPYPLRRSVRGLAQTMSLLWSSSSSALLSITGNLPAPKFTDQRIGDLSYGERKDLGAVCIQAAFGDEAHYAHGAPLDWKQHLSPRAQPRIPGDFAETWAHYRHIVDTLEIAGVFGIGLHPQLDKVGDLAAAADFESLWGRVFRPTGGDPVPAEHRPQQLQP